MYNTMSEEFRTIVKFRNYQVSNLGRVKNKTTNEILKGSLSGCGYMAVCLKKGNNKMTKTFHRLVADTFLENPFKKRCVSHKDGDRMNNCVLNLSFLTDTEKTKKSKVEI